MVAIPNAEENLDLLDEIYTRFLQLKIDIVDNLDKDNLFTSDNKAKKTEKVSISLSEISDDSIRKRLHFKNGDVVDENIIRRDLIHLYNMTIFDSVDYDIKEVNGENTVTIITKPSWNANSDIHFSINLEDDF